MKKNIEIDASGGNLSIQRIRRQITDMGLVAQGTLSKRMKICGRVNCRCAEDPQARLGPYYEWTRRENGRYLNTLVTEEQARELISAIENHRRVLELIKRWSNETAIFLEIKKRGK